MDQFFSEQRLIGISAGIAMKLEVVFPEAIYQSIPARIAGVLVSSMAGVPESCGRVGWNTPPTELLMRRFECSSPQKLYVSEPNGNAHRAGTERVGRGEL